MNKYSMVLLVLILLCICAFFVKSHGNVGFWSEAHRVSNDNADEGSSDIAPKVAITFDDGPNPEWTPVLLDGLKERGVKATFFVIGENAQLYPEIVRRMQEEGHLIGNHTFSHVQLTTLPEGEAQIEVEKANQLIHEITGEYPQYLRPPFGAWSEELDKLGMFFVKWTIDTLDWTTRDADYIVNKAVSQAKENSIILLHDNYESSVEAAFRIIDRLQERGFEFVTVEEILVD